MLARTKTKSTFHTKSVKALRFPSSLTLTVHNRRQLIAGLPPSRPGARYSTQAQRVKPAHYVDPHQRPATFLDDHHNLFFFIISILFSLWYCRLWLQKWTEMTFLPCLKSYHKQKFDVCSKKSLPMRQWNGYTVYMSTPVALLQACQKARNRSPQQIL